MKVKQVWTLRLLLFAFILIVTIASEALAGDIQNEQIEVSLGQDAATIPDVNWGWDMGSLQKKADVTIHLPDGRTYKGPSEITIFTRNKGRIAGVILTPSLTKLTTFEGAVGEVRGIAKALGIEKDAKLSARIREWETTWKSQPQTSYSGRCDLGKGASLYIEVRQHPSGRGYYLDVHFASLKLMMPKGMEGMLPKELEGGQGPQKQPAPGR